MSRPMFQQPMRDVYGRIGVRKVVEKPTVEPAGPLPAGPAVRRTVKQAYVGRFGGPAKVEAERPAVTRHIV